MFSDSEVLVLNRAAELVGKMADSDSGNFKNLDSDSGLANILMLLLIKIMKQCKKSKLKNFAVSV